MGGLLSSTSPSGSTFISYDGNGNVTGEIDAISGNLTFESEFDAFGNPLASRLESQVPFGFSTKYTDEESGYLYYGYRYYDPKHGRWPSRDPIGETGGLNTFAFLGNDGISRIDVLGQNPGLWKWISDVGTAITYATLVSPPETKEVFKNQWYGYRITPTSFNSLVLGFTRDRIMAKTRTI